MARLYTNENFPLQIADKLRSMGHDVLTIQETGGANRATMDEEVLAFAVQENRILLTLNRKHFIRLHSTYPDHAGIIVCSFDADFERLSQQIHLAIYQNESLNGKLFRINRPNQDRM